MNSPSNFGTTNAVVHAHTSANIAYDYGDFIASVGGVQKEMLPGGNDPADIYRDLYNNEVGITIAEYAKMNNLSKQQLDDLIYVVINRRYAP